MKEKVVYMINSQEKSSRQKRRCRTVVRPFTGFSLRKCKLYSVINTEPVFLRRVMATGKPPLLFKLFATKSPCSCWDHDEENHNLLATSKVGEMKNPLGILIFRGISTSRIYISRHPKSNFLVDVSSKLISFKCQGVHSVLWF